MKQYQCCEWDGGVARYIVINDDSFYWFMDKSKNMDNVLIGDLEICIKGSEINLAKQEYNTDGYYLYIVYNKTMYQGNELDTWNEQLLFFSPESDNGSTYKVINMDTSHEYMFVRVE